MGALGIIPARGGSKGIPHKNLYPLLGKPLLRYTVEAAKVSRLTEIVVTSDDPAILAQAYDVRAIHRPADIAADATPMLPVIRHAVEATGRQWGAIVILQATSPLRTAADIDHALDLLGQGDSVVSVCSAPHPVKCYDGDGAPLGGSLPYDKHVHECWARNGAIFALRTSVLAQGRLWSERPVLMTMPRGRSIDIDTFDDMRMAEAMLQAGVLERARSVDRLWGDRFGSG